MLLCHGIRANDAAYVLIRKTVKRLHNQSHGVEQLSRIRLFTGHILEREGLGVG